MNNLIQITRNDDTGCEWLVDVCNHIDNPDTLEMCLIKAGYPCKITANGLFANTEHVKKVDQVAWLEAQKADKENYESSNF